MYFEHYHLKKKPFGLTPGPDFFWLSEKHKEALATLRYGVIGDLGFLLLTGEVGVGKTALIHRLVASLDSSTIVAHITDPGLGINDFFRLLAVEFGIDTPFSSKGEFLIILERFLRQADKEQKKVLLIVDEAQRLNNVLLDEIRVLSNIELNDRKLINIFFIGQPEFKKMLLAANNRPIRQRIALYHHVGPLTEAETGQYIAHRLKIAGTEQKIFESEAIREIHRITKGYPRSINIICDYALLTGFASGVQTIDAKIVCECENELNIDADDAAIDVPSPAPTPTPEINPVPREKAPRQAPATDPPPPRQSRTWAFPAVIAAGIVLVMLAGYYFLAPDPGGTLPVQEASAPPAHRIPNAPVETEGPHRPSPAPETAPARTGSPGENRGMAEQQEPNVTQPETGSDPITELIFPTPPPDLDLPAPPTVAGEANRPVDGQPPSEKMASPDGVTPAAIPDGPDSQPGIAEQPGAEEMAADSPAVDSALLANAEPQPAGQEGISTAEAPEEAPIEQPTTAQQSAAAPSSDTNASPSPLNPPAAGPAADRSAAASEQPSSPAAQTPGDRAVTTAEEAPGVADAAIPKPAAAIIPAAKPAAGDRTPAKEITPPKEKADASGRQPATPSSPAEEPAPAAAGSTPEKDLSAGSSEPAIPDTAALAPQTGGDDAAGDATPQVNENMEDRLRSFLKAYCTTYASKDLDSFIDFFASDAVENGKPFESLLPKYQRNFTFIDTIYYRIELQDVTPSEDGEMVKIDGDFFLRWLPPDKKWRENAGKIQMTLEDNGSSFLVHRLAYQSNRSEQN